MNPYLTKREVITLVLEGYKPPYVPWSISYTLEAGEKLRKHYGVTDLEEPLQNHMERLMRYEAKRNVPSILEKAAVTSFRHPILLKGMYHWKTCSRQLKPCKINQATPDRS